MLFPMWFRKFHLNIFFKSIWQNLKNKLANLFSSIEIYEKELDFYLSPQEEVAKLYELINHGRSASQLFAKIEEMAIGEEYSPEECAKANLLLSHLYSQEIKIRSFSLEKNLEKAASFKNKATFHMGLDPSLSEKSKKVIECIRLGGECQYAFKKLQEYSAGKDLRASWANKALSFIFKTGFSKGDFYILPDKNKSQIHLKKAILGLQLFEKKLNELTDKLKGVWFKKKEAFRLILKIADVGNQSANLEYAKYLFRKDKKNENYKYYLVKAAQRTKESLFSLKNEGNESAQKFLLQTDGIKTAEINNELQSSHNRFQIALYAKEKLSNPLAKAFQSQARNGSKVANLQAGLYSLRKKGCNLEEAEKFFDIAYKAKGLENSSYEQTLLEELILKLTKHFESLLLEDPESLNFKLNYNSEYYLSKIIFYLKHIPNDSTAYNEAQFRIAHYQKYFLKQEKEAALTFQKLSLCGDVDSAYLAISIGFNDYWKQQQFKFSSIERDVVRKYEQKHKPFTDQVIAYPKDTKYDDSKGVLPILKAIEKELERFYETQGQKDEISVALEDIKIAISKLEANYKVDASDLLLKLKNFCEFAVHFNPELKKKYAHLWASHENSPLNSTVFNIAKAPKELSEFKTLLEAQLNFLAIIKQQKQGNDKNYFEIVDKVFLYYVATTYRQALAVNNSNQGDMIGGGYQSSISRGIYA